MQLDAVVNNTETTTVQACSYKHLKRQQMQAKMLQRKIKRAQKQRTVKAGTSNSVKVAAGGRSCHM